MKKIYEDDPWYSLLRRVTDIWIRGSFKRIRYVGLENIPKDGAVIFAPNHCDALMDPLAVLAMNHDKKVFVARADIFKKPALEKILTFFKIMPIHRVRDGFRNVAHTEETIEKSVEVLNNQVPFCILPEGMHRSMHSLLPLGKGLSRIACRAEREKPGDGHVYIVPIGCEYGDYYRFRSTLLMTIGQPIDVTEYIAAHPEKAEPELYSDLRSLTAREMKKYIVFIPDDEDYPATWEISKLLSGHIPEYRLQRRMEANRKAAERIGQLREDKPEKARKLFEKALAFAQARRDASVSIHATYSDHPLVSALWRTAKTLVGLPFALVYAIVSLPVWALGERLSAKAKDRTFHNSFRCASVVFLWTLLLLIWAIVLFCTMKWYWALTATVLIAPAPLLLYDWMEQARRCASAWRYLFNGRLRRQKNELMNELKSIA